MGVQKHLSLICITKEMTVIFLCSHFGALGLWTNQKAGFWILDQSEAFPPKNFVPHSGGLFSRGYCSDVDGSGFEHRFLPGRFWLRFKSKKGLVPGQRDEHQPSWPRSKGMFWPERPHILVTELKYWCLSYPSRCAHTTNVIFDVTRKGRPLLWPKDRGVEGQTFELKTGHSWWNRKIFTARGILGLVQNLTESRLTTSRDAHQTIALALSQCVQIYKLETRQSDCMKDYITLQLANDHGECVRARIMSPSITTTINC